MEILNTFLPHDRRYSILNQIDMPEQTAGAALFVDISGYSTITNTLAHTLGSKRGSEVMTHQLNQLYSMLITWVHAYQGSVIIYAGDSLTCWFDDQFGLQKDYSFSGAERAVSCALKMQSAIMNAERHVDDSNSSIRFNIKISITAGTVNRLLVGDPNIQYFEVIAGQLVDRLGIAEQLIEQEEIIVGREVLTAVSYDLNIKEWRLGPADEEYAVISNQNPTIETNPWEFQSIIEEQIAQKWLQHTIYQKLSDKNSAFIAELRPTVALFISFTGVDFETDHLAKLKLNKYIQWIQRVIYQVGGILVQLSIGDKGSYCYAIFESGFTQDDTMNAISAALQIHKTPAPMSYIQTVKIGISTGVLYAGTYGSHQRNTFSVQGQETNLAARLMQYAKPGEILVSARISNRAKSQFHFIQIDTIQLKGFDKPIPIFAVHTLEDAPPEIDKSYKRSAKTFIGRKQELVVLKKSLGEYLEGQKRLVYIEGQAGSGKTTLLTKFHNTISDTGLICLLGHGNLINQDTPYYAWVDIILHLFNVEPNDSQSIIEEKIASKLLSVTGSKEYAPIFNPICQLKLPETPITKTLSSEARAHHFEMILTQLWRHFLETNDGVLVFEDAHWIDSASWRLIHKLLTTCPKFFIIIVSRPIKKGINFSDELGFLNQFPFLELIQLHAFSWKESEALLCHCLNATAVPGSIVEFIHKLGQGNPFFCIEMAYTLQESKYLTVRNGRCFITKTISQIQSQFPESIQGIIISRLEHLPASQVLILKIASVIGFRFKYKLLEDIFSQFEPANNLPFFVDNLQNLNFIVPSKKESGTFEFKHHLIQEAIYSVLTFTQRRQLHKAVAQWFEQYVANSTHKFYETLAFHWEKAEEIDKGIHYLKLAGENAWRQFAHKEVIRIFSRAIAITTGEEIHISNIDRAKMFILIGRAYVFKTNYQDGRLHLEDGLNQLHINTYANKSKFKQISKLLAGIVRLFVQPKFSLFKPQYSPEERQKFQLGSQALLRLIEIYYHSDEPLLSTLSTLNALQLAEKVGDCPELAETLAIVGSFFSFLRMKRLARSYYLRSLRIARRIKSQDALSFSLLVKTTFDLGQGKWKNADFNIQHLIHLNQQSGDQRRLLDGQQLLTISLYLQEKFQQSIKAGEKLIELATQENDQRFLGHGYFALAYCRHQMNGPGTSQYYLNDLEEVILSKNSRLIDQQLVFNTISLLAHYHLEKEEYNKGVHYVMEAKRLASGAFQSSFYTLPGYTMLSLANLKCVQKSLIEPREMDQLLKNFKQYTSTFPIGKPAFLKIKMLFEQYKNRTLFQQ
ncbi:MAG: AAA family ATPase [Chloroflexota bacterium]